MAEALKDPGFLQIKKKLLIINSKKGRRKFKILEREKKDIFLEYE